MVKKAEKYAHHLKILKNSNKKFKTSCCDPVYMGAHAKIAQKIAQKRQINGVDLVNKKIVPKFFERTYEFVHMNTETK